MKRHPVWSALFMLAMIGNLISAWWDHNLIGWLLAILLALVALCVYRAVPALRRRLRRRERA